MSKIKLMLLSLIVAGSSISSAQAACVGEDAKVCVEGHVAVGLQQTSNDDVSNMAIGTDAEITTVVTLPENNGWTTSVQLELDSADLNEFKTIELSATNQSVTVIAGKTEIGGVDQGNAYTTELGSSNEGTYGDSTILADDIIAVGFNAGADITIGLGMDQYEAVPGMEDDASTEADESSDAVNADSTSYAVVVAGEAAGLGYGLEIEGRSYSEADVDGAVAPDAKSTLTVGLQYTVADFTPFVNVGTYTQNADVTEQSTNFGLDAKISEELGLTVALETIDSGIEGDDDAESHTYVNGSYALFGDTALGFGYFTSSKGDVSSNEITLELLANF